MRIALIDYDSGNLFSVTQALRHVGAEVERVTSAEAVSGFDGMVLPGVGAFGDAAAKLASRGLMDPVRAWIAEDRPFFGICVGYQLLFSTSEESPDARGLGVLPGRVRRFTPSALKIPQIGWNQVQWKRPDPMVEGLQEPSWFYFVHSFFPEPEDPTLVAGTAEYGETFAAAVRRGNLTATQFHPEKSQADGLRLLRNFVERIA